MSRAFTDIPVAERGTKPRLSGRTMMIDWGIGPQRQSDVLRIGHEFVDIAKIAVGISGIIDRNLLVEKIAEYLTYQVKPFIGGQFLEYAIHHNGMESAESYFAEVAQLGFPLVEVSDNTLELASNDKIRLIKNAADNHGLEVLGEVGSKTEHSTAQAMIEDVNRCLDAGASLVLLEAAEFFSTESVGMNRMLFDAVVSQINPATVMFELPGPWISNVHSCDIHDMTQSLIDAFGPEANIANVMPDWIIELETMRRGIGVGGV